MEQPNGGIEMRMLLLFSFFISLTSQAVEQSSTKRDMVFSKKHIAFIDEFNGSTHEEFMSSYGQFEILVPKQHFIFQAPNCQKNIKLRMIGVSPDTKNSNEFLESHWKLLQEFRAVAEGKLDKLTVRVDVSPYFKKTKNGEIILKYCNAFIPADFWKYSPDNNESNALGKPVEQQSAPLDLENK